MDVPSSFHNEKGKTHLEGVKTTPAGIPHHFFTKAKLVYSTSDNSKPWGWAAHEKGICRPDGGS